MGSRIKDGPADQRVQFSLRISPDLHAKLIERAGTVPLNSYIAQQLEALIKWEESFESMQEIQIDSRQSFESLRLDVIRQQDMQAITQALVIELYCQLSGLGEDELKRKLQAIGVDPSRLLMIRMALKPKAE
jgi:hypothetical protein